MSKNLPEKSSKTAFLEKVGALSKPKDTSKIAVALQKTPKLLFSMDATASRQPTWDVAQEITFSMFDVIPGGLKIALAHHCGGRLQPVTEFRDDPKYFKDQIAAVRCVAGNTALCEVLDTACDIPSMTALIYIGDCFEENLDSAIHHAQKLKAKGVRCFMFQEGNDPTAHEAFNAIAEITGGAVFPFAMDSLVVAREKLEAIAAYAAGGMKLLQEKRASLPGASELIAKLDNQPK
jgi:hypothetical protein